MDGRGNISVVFPVSWTRGVRHWSSPGQPQLGTRWPAEINAFIKIRLVRLRTALVVKTRKDVRFLRREK